MCCSPTTLPNSCGNQDGLQSVEAHTADVHSTPQSSPQTSAGSCPRLAVGLL